MTIEDALAGAAAALRPVSDSPRLDAELLLAHVLGHGRASLHAHAADVLPAAAGARFDAFVARRGDGEPVAYVLGDREFWSLPFAVTPAVLIPRPDTETLVAAALEIGGAGASVVDLGTGSGAVAVALAHERPAWRVVATDADPAALEVARANAVCNRVRVEVRLGDWCAPLAGERYDVIVSNPPYIPDTDPHLARGDVRFEPRHALAAGADGLHAIRAIAACAPAHLDDGGWLLLEHGHDQAASVAEILHGAGFDGVRQWRDLGGTKRVTGGIWPNRDAESVAPTGAAPTLAASP